MPMVSLTQKSNRRETVFEALRRLPYEMISKLETAQDVFIKPNLVDAFHPLACTHVDALRAVLDFVRVHTQAPVTIADAAYHGTHEAFEKLGCHVLVIEYKNIRLFDLNEDETVPGFYLLRDGSTDEIGLSKHSIEAGFTINLALMKTHRDVGATLSIKNWAIGTVPAKRHSSLLGNVTYPRWTYLHEQGSEAHHKSIAALYNQHPPDLSVIDAWVGMEGDGPTRGTPVDMHIALASTDGVALDSVACKLMDIDPSSIPYLVEAAKPGYDFHDLYAGKLISDKPIESYKRLFN